MNLAHFVLTSLLLVISESAVLISAFLFVRKPLSVQGVLSAPPPPLPDILFPVLVFHSALARYEYLIDTNELVTKLLNFSVYPWAFLDSNNKCLSFKR